MNAKAYETLKNIVKGNVNDMYRVSQSVIGISKQIKEFSVTLQQIVSRLEILERSSLSHNNDGVRAFSVNSSHSQENSDSRQLILNATLEELEQLVSQHPNWLRPFAITAELQKREEIDDRIRVIRSTSGYLNVIRLQTGSEWAYFEPMSIKRICRLPLLREVFKLPRNTPTETVSAYVVKPVRLGTLQKAVLWEIRDFGIMEVDAT